MTPVTQTLLHDPEKGVRGNCQQAAVASILDLPIDAVPNFHECPEGFWDGFRNFIRSHGYAVLALSHSKFDYWLKSSDVHYLAYGKSPRGIYHACVYRNGVLAHDPHPSRGGLVDVEEANVLVRL